PRGLLRARAQSDFSCRLPFCRIRVRHEAPCPREAQCPSRRMKGTQRSHSPLDSAACNLPSRRRGPNTAQIARRCQAPKPAIGTSYPSFDAPGALAKRCSDGPRYGLNVCRTRNRGKGRPVRLLKSLSVLAGVAAAVLVMATAGSAITNGQPDGTSHPYVGLM